MDEQTTISRATDQVECDIDGEKIILHLADGVYFGLNPIGAYIWDQLKQDRSFAELTTTLLSEFDVDVETCQVELTRLLRQLSEKNLVELSA